MSENKVRVTLVLTQTVLFGKVMAKECDAMANFDERYFNYGAQQEYDTSLVGEGEQILWQGKPNRKAFILAQAVKMLPFAILWLAVDGGIIATIVSTAKDLPPWTVVFFVAFFLIHLLPVWVWASNLLTAGKRQKNTDYIFTDKRIIIKSGFIGIDIVNIYYTDVFGVNLKVGLTDKMFHVGDIYISGKGKAQVLWDIDDPYNVVSKLQKIVNDIKTDTMFPNNLRPDENDGYNTRYNGGQ